MRLRLNTLALIITAFLISATAQANPTIDANAPHYSAPVISCKIKQAPEDFPIISATIFTYVALPFADQPKKVFAGFIVIEGIDENNTDELGSNDRVHIPTLAKITYNENGSISVDSKNVLFRQLVKPWVFSTAKSQDLVVKTSTTDANDAIVFTCDILEAW